MVHRLYLHLVWVTRERAPLLDADRAACVERLIRVVAQQEGSTVLGVGMVSTHLHILLRVHPRFDSGRFVQRVKSIGALVSRRDGLGDPAKPLRWAKGYSMTTVGPRSVPAVLGYLRDQPVHHPLEVIVRAVL